MYPGNRHEKSDFSYDAAGIRYHAAEEWLENPYRRVPIEMEIVEPSEYMFIFIHSMGGSKSSFGEEKCARDIMVIL